MAHGPPAGSQRGMKTAHLGLSGDWQPMRKVRAVFKLLTRCTLFNMAGTPAAAPAPQRIRAQLDRILGHEIFSRSERLSRFLRYVVEETLAGRGAERKEPVLAAELYGKRTGAEAGDDSTVRVDARRLRDKLREYYGEATSDPIIITLPKGGYTPAFEQNPAARAPDPLSAPTPVAFVWGGGSAKPGQTDIFVKAVEGEERRRLTDTPVSEWTPASSYRWQQEFFENGAAAFEQKTRPNHSAEQERIAYLEKKIQTKDEVLAELMAEHVALKKDIGEL
jgi:hypothetical protein